MKKTKLAKSRKRRRVDSTKKKKISTRATLKKKRLKRSVVSRRKVLKKKPTKKKSTKKKGIKRAVTFEDVVKKHYPVVTRAKRHKKILERLKNVRHHLHKHRKRIERIIEASSMVALGLATAGSSMVAAFGVGAAAEATSGEAFALNLMAMGEQTGAQQTAVAAQEAIVGTERVVAQGEGITNEVLAGLESRGSEFRLGIQEPPFVKGVKAFPNQNYRFV